MLHFAMAATILIGIVLCGYSAVMLIDEINMGRKFGEESRRSYLIWGLIFLISLASVVISWVSLPGSKWFVAVYFVPAITLVLITNLFVSREWFGVSFMAALCITWIVFGGFFASLEVYNSERGGRVGNYNQNCTYERSPGTIHYERHCNKDI